MLQTVLKMIQNQQCFNQKCEIIYGEDENPNDGYFPQYVIVDFPQYCGPPWMIEHPT